PRRLYLARLGRLDRSPGSLHDALPIFQVAWPPATASVAVAMGAADGLLLPAWSVLTARNSYVPAVSSDASNCAHHSVVATLPLADRKSTRLNSSHGSTSYAVFCLQHTT